MIDKLYKENIGIHKWTTYQSRTRLEERVSLGTGEGTQLITC